MWKWLRRQMMELTMPAPPDEEGAPILEVIDRAQMQYKERLGAIAMNQTTEMALRCAIAAKLGKDIREVPDFRKGGTVDGITIIMDDCLPDGTLAFMGAKGEMLEE